MTPDRHRRRRPFATPMRALIVRLHRYAGLTVAVFLILAGVTGSLLAFYHELDAWLNPALFRVDSSAGGQSPLVIAAAVERDDRLQVTWLPLSVVPGRSLELGVGPRRDPATGQAFPLSFDQLFVDPSDGRELGRRSWGACCLSRVQFMPFVYAVHYSLFLPGKWGVWLMGLVGLVWFIDCFFGLALTFPRRMRLPGRSLGHANIAIDAVPGGYLARWGRAWRIKWDAGRARLNLDLHRAGGLWFWFVLLAMALSSVSFNLHDELFAPVVDAISPLTPTPFDERVPQVTTQPIDRKLSLTSIVDIARNEARRRAWPEAPSGVHYSAIHGIASVRFGVDHAAGLGNRWLYVDGVNGEVLGAHIPGEGTAGDLFQQLQFPLHSGQIAGLAGRIFVCLTGVAVVVLSLTGALVWSRKRRRKSRRRADERMRAVPAMSPNRFRANHQEIP